MAHFLVSLIKSAVRIAGFGFLAYDTELGIGILISAEVIGVLEEFVA